MNFIVETPLQTFLDKPTLKQSVLSQSVKQTKRKSSNKEGVHNC